MQNQAILSDNYYKKSCRTVQHTKYPFSIQPFLKIPLALNLWGGKELNQFCPPNDFNGWHDKIYSIFCNSS